MENVFAFFSCDHKTGVTMLAQCAAESLAKKLQGKDILLVHCNAGPGGEYFGGVTESLEHIKPYIPNGLFTGGDLKRNCKHKGNLYILGGFSGPENAGLNPDMLSLLLGYLSQQFACIICDCGAEINCGSALGALFSAESIYMVLNPAEGILKKYEWQSCLYSKLLIAPGKFILNRYSSGGIYNLNYVSQRLQISKNLIMPVCTHPNGQLAELQGESLLALGNGRFRKDINSISEDLLCQII